MIIDAAIDYATRMGITTIRPKQEVAPCICAIDLDRDGHASLTRLGVVLEGKKGAPRRYVAAQMWVPKRNARTGDAEPEFIVDKVEYVLGSKGSRAEEQFGNYRKKIAAAVENTGDEALRAILQFLDSKTEVAHCLKEYASLFDETSGGNIVFRYKGGIVHEREAVRDYWLTQPLSTITKKVPKKPKAPKTANCTCCGKECIPVEKHSKVSGGGIRGSLVSFGNNASESYGFKGSENFPFCEACEGAYTVALQRVLKDGFPHPVTNEPMPRMSFTLSDKTVAIWMGGEGNTDIDLDLKAIWEGGDFSKLPEGDSQWFHYAVLAQLSTGRLSVKEYRRISLAELVQSLRTYQQELEIVGIWPNDKNPYSLWWFTRALLGKSGKKIKPSFASDLFMCAMDSSNKYPRWMEKWALNRVGRGRGPNPALASLLKAILIRNYQVNKSLPEEQKLAMGLNVNFPSNAYQFGCYFAVVEYAHKSAIDPNRTLSDSLWVKASTRPAFVIAKLTHKMAICVKKDKRLRYLLKRVSEIWERISTDNIPVSFTPQEQAEFTTGYQHQNAALYTAKPKTTLEVPTDYENEANNDK